MKGYPKRMEIKRGVEKEKEGGRKIGGIRGLE